MESIPDHDAWKTAIPEDRDHLQECPRHEDHHDGEPAVCICPTPQDLKDAAAEARVDARKEEGART